MRELILALSEVAALAAPRATDTQRAIHRVAIDALHGAVEAHAAGELQARGDELVELLRDGARLDWLAGDATRGNGDNLQREFTNRLGDMPTEKALRAAIDACIAFDNVKGRAR